MTQKLYTATKAVMTSEKQDHYYLWLTLTLTLPITITIIDREK